MITMNWLLMKEYVLKHIRIITLLTAVAMVLGVVVSHPAVIKPKYKSRIVFYPSNISPYSKESETEQALQFMDASYIRDNVIKQFDLYTHYDIAPNQPKSLFYMHGVYGENVRVSKTNYEAIEVIVVDEDAQMAYNMVNAIVDLYNKKVKQLHEQKSNEVAALYLVQMQQQQRYIDSLAALEQPLREQYGVLSYDIQVEQATKGAYQGTRSADAQKLLANLAKYGNASQNIGAQLELLRIDYAKSVEFYFNALKERNNKFTFTNVVVDAFVADKKHYPVRWLIVVSLALSTLVLSCIGAIVIEARQQR